MSSGILLGKVTGLHGVRKAELKWLIIVQDLYMWLGIIKFYFLHIFNQNMYFVEYSFITTYFCCS